MTFRIILSWQGNNRYPVEGVRAEVTHVQLITAGPWNFDLPLKIKSGAYTYLADYILKPEEAKDLKFRVKVLTHSGQNELLEITAVRFPPSFRPKEVYLVDIINKRNRNDPSRKRLSVIFENVTSGYNAAFVRGEIEPDARSLFLFHLKDKLKIVKQEGRDSLRKIVLLGECLNKNFENVQNVGKEEVEPPNIRPLSKKESARRPSPLAIEQKLTSRLQSVV